MATKGIANNVNRCFWRRTALYEKNEDTQLVDDLKKILYHTVDMNTFHPILHQSFAFMESWWWWALATLLKTTVATVKLGKSVNNNRIVRSFIKCTELIYSCKRGRHNKFSSPAGRLFTPQSIADNNRSIPSCWPRCDDGWWRDHGALNDQRLINRPRRTGLNVFLRQCVCACVYSCVLDSCVTLMNVWEQIP